MSMAKELLPVLLKCTEVVLYIYYCGEFVCKIKNHIVPLKAIPSQ